MYARENFGDVRFAQEQVAHERKVIEKFAEDPTNENVASVTLEVSGVEHIILIHDEDYKALAKMLLRFNTKERVSLEGKQLIQSATSNRALSYAVGCCMCVMSFLSKVASVLLPSSLMFGRNVNL